MPAVPARTFDRAARAIAHVKKHHVKKKLHAPAGTKQLKVAQAIYDNDRITGAQGGNYLLRSGIFIRRCVGRQLGSTTASVSRWEKSRKLALLLDATGPRYVLETNIGRTLHARKLGYCYYTREFGLAVFRSALLNRASFEKVRLEMTAKSQAHGNEGTSLLP